MCYSTDSTGHIHLSGKASHHASKTAVDYYNASFLDVSPSNFCYHIHWLLYTFTHFSRGRNSVNKEVGVICLSQYVTLCGQCSRHTCSDDRLHISVYNVLQSANGAPWYSVICSLWTVLAPMYMKCLIMAGTYVLYTLSHFFYKGLLCSKGLHCCSSSNEPHQGWLLETCVAVPHSYHCAPDQLHGGEAGKGDFHFLFVLLLRCNQLLQWHFILWTTLLPLSSFLP